MLLMMGSCSRQESLKIGRNNRIFGKIPALCAAEAGARTRLIAADKETLDPDKRVRYAATRISIEQSVEKRLAEEMEKVEGRQVPCEALPQAGYEVAGATVAGWDYPSRTLRIALRVTPASGAVTAADTVCYLKSVDGDGAMLDFGAVRLAAAEEQSAEALLEGDYGCMLVDSTRSDNPDFTAFSKLVVIPADEYRRLESERLAAREAEEARKQAELERAAKAYNVLPDPPVKPGEIPGLPFKTK